MTQENAQAGWSEDMDQQEHLQTYDGFLHGAKYGSIAVIVLLVLMAMFLL